MLLPLSSKIMAKEAPEGSRGTVIPNDIDPNDEKYAYAIFCFPNTRMWRATVRGLINLFARGRFWRANTGPDYVPKDETVKYAQALGEEIYGSLCIVSCDVFERLVQSNENLTKAQLMMFSALTSEEVSLNFDPEANPDHPFHQETFQVKSLFKTDFSAGLIDFDDLSLADLLYSGLFANKPGFIEEFINTLKYGEGIADVIHEKAGSELVAQHLEGTNEHLDLIAENTEHLAFSASNLDDKAGNLKTIADFGKYFSSITNAIQNIVIDIPPPLNFGHMVTALNKIIWLIGRPSMFSGSDWYQWFVGLIGLDEDPDTHVIGLMKQSKDAMFQTANPTVNITDTIKELEAQVANISGGDNSALIAKMDGIITALNSQVAALESQKEVLEAQDMNVHINTIKGGDCS